MKKGIGIVIAAIVALVFGFIVFPHLPHHTTDDAQFLQEYIDESNTGSVLGASSDDTVLNTACPESKPIIGWIDFEGNKTIRQTLPQDQYPSACFSSLEEAVAAGYKAL